MSTYTNDVAHQTQTASCQAEQRAYLRKLIETRIVATNGERPSFDDCSHIEQRAVKLIEESAQSGAPSSSIEGILKQHAKAFQRLLAESTPEVEIPNEIPNDEAIMPRLPESAHRTTGLLNKVSPWLASYINYSRQVSPEGYKDFHLACGLWVLSTVAARRIQVPLATPVITPLSILMVARTSLFAKSTTATAGIRLLKASDLGFLLGADETTPQKLLYRMAGHVPANYGDMTFERQELVKRRLPFTAQIGWYYDETNQLINAMTRPGPMAEFAGLIRKLDNCPDEYSYETKSGEDYIRNPYLAFLGSTNTANIARHANKGGEFWNDGFWARMLFICPPPDDFITQTMQECIVCPPGVLSTKLTRWHHELGIPGCSITEIRDEKDKATGRYDATVEPLPLHTCTLEQGVLAAFTTYRLALRTILAQDTSCQDLDGSYARLPTMALRIAALLSSLENNGRITLDCWSLAQEIAEMFRENLHRLYAQVSVASDDNPLEDVLIEYMKTLNGKQTTIRDILTYGPTSLRKLKSEGVRNLLIGLERSGIVTSKKEGKKEWYSLDTSAKI